MTFTYDSPPTTPAHEVRFRSTDTRQTEYSASDEDIEYLLGQNDGDIFAAAAEVARAIGRRWAQTASRSKSVGPLSLGAVNASEVAKGWFVLADELVLGNSGRAFAGPVFSTSAAPTFTLGMHDGR